MNLFDLTGKKALVTGAGSPSGLGRAMAQALQEQGAEVAILSRSARIFDIAREDGFFGIQADLVDREALKRGFDEALAHLGALDILVNAHGITKVHPAETFPVAEWDKMLEINLTSVFLLCQMAARIMIPKAHGKIINLASMTTFFGSTLIPSYAASKGGVGQLTRALANEWAGQGINVNAIAPGYMDTEMTAGLKTNHARRQEIFMRIPAGRFGTAGDIKGIAVFLASQASDYVHGAIIPVDGGYLGR
ncbi:MAG: SDR family oxidoreductase [Chloroflexi bacterium]|nr:SDR family oxidoreductase [Chloroflexota bacterium]